MDTTANKTDAIPEFLELRAFGGNWQTGKPLLSNVIDAVGEM